MYKVYFMNRFVRSFATRDAALAFIANRAVGNSFGDYEILDGSND